MNIFFLHRDPSRAAKAQCDKHIVKMVLETTQMLSTAARRNGFDIGYKAAYPKHPMTIWVGDTHDNFVGLLNTPKNYLKNIPLVMVNFTHLKKLLIKFMSIIQTRLLIISLSPHSACQMNLNNTILYVLTEIIMYIKLVNGKVHQNGLKV